VTKSCNAANYVEAYHIDKHCGNDAEKLHYHLDTMTKGEADYVTMLLYISPQSLQMDSPWYGVLRCIALKDFLCLVCIDEAHTVHQDGYFCLEFQSAVGTIQHLHGLLTIKCSIIVMLATFRQVDQDIITALLAMPPSMVMWLELSRRQICFNTVRCGNPTVSVTSSMEQDATLSSSNKTIVYSNSKMKAQGTLTDACETLRKRGNSHNW
jgi:superfamily II DNA helicase RecQ